jgi:hypothetical protein
METWWPICALSKKKIGNSFTDTAVICIPFSTLTLHDANMCIWPNINTLMCHGTTIRAWLSVHSHSMERVFALRFVYTQLLWQLSALVCDVINLTSKLMLACTTLLPVAGLFAHRHVTIVACLSQRNYLHTHTQGFAFSNRKSQTMA